GEAAKEAPAGKTESGEAKSGGIQFQDKAEAVEWAVTTLGIKESTAKSYSMAKLQERADKYEAEKA
ncbi:MAG TPA: trigger factor, partial [Pseudodesulfovibrio sp.]|nr:trigger factor [Pseudodesulfovibrio sp.]